MNGFIDKNFEFLGEGKGTWTLKYGNITEEIEYTNENFINKDYTIGYCKIETKKKDILHVFLSKTNEKEIITSAGLQEGTIEHKNILFNAIKSGQDIEASYQAHLQSIKGLNVVAEKKYFEKELKGHTLPLRLYEIIKEIAIQKLKTPELWNEEKYQEKYQKYLKFIDEKFTRISHGSGAWFVPLGETTEKIKYTVENFINQENNIGYCKVARKDGLIVHVFISHFEGKDMLTVSGLYNTQVDLGDMLLNTVDLHSDLENHYLAHVKSCQGKTPIAGKQYLENILGKNRLAEQLYSIIKKAVIKTMGLSNLWTSEKIDNIIRKYLKKATKI